MFKRADRLNRVRFQQIFNVGKRTHAPTMTAIAAPLAMGRGVAVVVGKKVSKKAVDRNLIRRRIYATLRQLADQSGYLGGLIVITKPPIKKLSRSELKSAVESVFATVSKNS